MRLVRYISEHGVFFLDSFAIPSLSTLRAYWGSLIDHYSHNDRGYQRPDGYGDEVRVHLRECLASRINQNSKYSHEPKYNESRDCKFEYGFDA